MNIKITPNEPKVCTFMGLPARYMERQGGGYEVCLSSWDIPRENHELSCIHESINQNGMRHDTVILFEDSLEPNIMTDNNCLSCGFPLNEMIHEPDLCRLRAAKIAESERAKSTTVYATGDMTCDTCDNIGLWPGKVIGKTETWKCSYRNGAHGKVLDDGTLEPSPKKTTCPKWQGMGSQY